MDAVQSCPACGARVEAHRLACGACGHAFYRKPVRRRTGSTPDNNAHAWSDIVPTGPETTLPGTQGTTTQPGQTLTDAVAVPHAAPTNGSGSSDVITAPGHQNGKTSPRSLTDVTGISELGFHGVPIKTGLLPRGLSPFEAFLLSLMDTCTPVDDVVAASGLSINDAALSLERLKGLQVITFTHMPPPRSARVTGQSTPSPADSTPAGALCAKVQALLDAGDLDGARALLPSMNPDGEEKVLALAELLHCPQRAADRARLLVALAHEAEQSRQVPQAMTHLHNALRETDALPDAHFNLATLMLRTQGSSAQTERHLARAVELEPDNPLYVAMRNRVRAFLLRPKRGRGH